VTASRTAPRSATSPPATTTVTFEPPMGASYTTTPPVPKTFTVLPGATTDADFVLMGVILGEL